MSLIPISTRDQLPADLGVEKLDIHEGDVLLIRAVRPEDGERWAKGLDVFLRAKEMTGVLLLVAAEGVDIEHFDKESMAAHGWYRA